MEPLKGYRPLTDAEIALANEGKTLAVLVEQYINKLRANPEIDQRWVSIGVTELQLGFMALVRSITRPTTF